MTKARILDGKQIPGRNFAVLLSRSISLLGLESRNKLILIACIQILIGTLDLFAVGLIGVIGVLSISGVQSGAPGGRILNLIEFLHLQNTSFQNQVAILGVMAVSIFLFKTIVSILFTKKILLFLAVQSASISSSVIANLLHGPHTFIRKRNIQELIHNSTFAINAIVIGVVGGVLTLLSDISLTLIICTSLFLIDPVVAFSVVSLFGIIYWLLNISTHKLTKSLGAQNRLYAIATNKSIDSSLRLYRELTTLNQIDLSMNDISLLRQKHSRVVAELSFLPNVSKYVLETAVIFGALIISAIQFTLQDAKHAVAGLAVFLAAGSRIAPALLRLQQGTMSIQSNYAYAQQGLILSEQIHPYILRSREGLPEIAEAFIPEIQIKNLKFRFSDSNIENIDIPELRIEAGSIVGIVGPSGSGKSSLVDLLLGINPIQSGSILISGRDPRSASMKWPGLIAYVPQEIHIMDGSVRENILLRSTPDIPDLDILDRLEESKINEFICQLPNGLDTRLGSDGITLSGGQKQKIGIARALVRHPKLIVLDEATSALDADSENFLTHTLIGASSSATVVMVAHRLSSVVGADKVVYVNEGRIEFEGTFEQVRANVPNFDQQAKLMGL